jgi:Protein of unknown function (DUF3990)
MAKRLPLVPAPPTWTNPDLVLYHGTIDSFQASILASVDVTRGLRNTDFGRGFYTTTSLAQARAWSWQISQKNPGSLPAVISLTVGRDSLARLDSL